MQMQKRMQTSVADPHATAEAARRALAAARAVSCERPLFSPGALAVLLPKAKENQAAVVHVNGIKPLLHVLKSGSLEAKASNAE